MHVTATRFRFSGSGRQSHTSHTGAPADTRTRKRKRYSNCIFFAESEKKGSLSLSYFKILESILETALATVAERRRQDLDRLIIAVSTRTCTVLHRIKIKNKETQNADNPPFPDPFTNAVLLLHAETPRAHSVQEELGSDYDFLGAAAPTTLRRELCGKRNYKNRR